ncbi:hypothetical protein MKEN_01331500 [Mycena kentingensis (nom. inval.)]|nr:hypothetical protein MKEN_01331500 [Mycena kentingensis (nom. inval.)]
MGLKRKLGVQDIVIYERGSNVGGTWNERPQGSQKEIQDYWRTLTHRFDVQRHIAFNRLVTGAQWDLAQNLWKVKTVSAANSGKAPEPTTTTVTAKILITAVGILDSPRFPAISGIDSFKGTIFHSAQWRADVDLSGKRVAVIGNGASAYHSVRADYSAGPYDASHQLLSDAKLAMQPHSAPAKWAFRNIPFVLRIHRFMLFIFFEIFYLMIFSNKTRWFVAYIKAHAPAEYHDHLIPKYELGCKRIIFDTNYFASLHQPNHNLNLDGIAEITGNGIRTKTSENLPFDVIILATGFVAVGSSLFPTGKHVQTSFHIFQDKFIVPIRGASGQTIQYDAEGFPQAYKGTSVPGFPNMFMIAGPNTTTGHTSVTLFEELQVEYILRLIKPVLFLSPESSPLALSVSRTANTAYNVWLHARLERSVHTGCASWYRTGADSKGKISSIFPGSATLFWWHLRTVQWGDYVVHGDGRALTKYLWK